MNPQATPAVTKPAVRLDSVTVTFSRSRLAEPFRALDAVDMTVPYGYVTCLLGPNGSGKTTLINTITGLVAPSEGEVEVLDLAPTRDRRQLWRQLALVPQETAVYPVLTARENLRFHGEYYGLAVGETKRRVEEVLELVQLGNRANDRAGTFSGGMQRRLALAKALMMRPRLLLLDEPTLGVDVQSREAIWQRIRECANEGNAVLLTTNYMEEAQALGERIVIIDRGANVVAGTLTELTSDVPAPPPVEQPTASLQEVFLHFTGRDLRD